MEITAADVMKLRKMTSAGMMDCKKALTEAEGNFEKAVEIIREKGKLVAAKRADRETTEGAVLVRINGGKAVIVCLGCETDFVSATPDFKNLANSIADAAIAAFPADLEALKSVKLKDGYTVEEEISAQTGKTGEKHVLAYYESLEAPYIAQYVHNNNKVASIVSFNKEVPEEIGKNVAMQVTSMHPVSVSEADCPKETVEKELAMYKQQIAEDPKMAGKPGLCLRTSQRVSSRSSSKSRLLRIRSSSGTTRCLSSITSTLQTRMLKYLPSEDSLLQTNKSL